MIKIRRGLFETNSSSTHSLTMCSKQEYEDWVAGKVYLNDGWGDSDKAWLTKEDIIEEVVNDRYRKINKEYILKLSDKEFDKLARDRYYYSFDEYNDSELEHFKDSYITKSGEEVVAFGQYGYDG